MDRNSFNNLLEDLYDVFNPAKKSDIPSLLDKYVGEEFDAVYHLLLRYNYPRSQNFNPKLNQPETIKMLIRKYADGERVFKSMMPSSEPVITTEIIQQHTEKALKEASVKLEEISEERLNKIASKVKDMLISESESVSVEVVVEFSFNNEELKIKIPKRLESLSIGTRLIVLDEEGKPHGLEIKDVLEDYASYENKIVRTIIVDKI